MATSPIVARSPRTPKTPGIRFAITPPSVHSKKSVSIDGLPSVESVLQQYARDSDATTTDDAEETRMLKEDDLGEPGPAVEEAENVKKTSLWDRPHLASRAEAA